MKESGVLSETELNLNLYDGCTLKLCNVSKDKMDELKQYLSDDLTAEEMKEHDIARRNGFVTRSPYQKDSNFEELSVGYFKFESKSHLKLAKRKLTTKMKEESILFSDRIHREQQHYLKTADPNEKEEDLGWYHRDVPRCCCCPQHPHRAEDKLILIQNRRIISRQFNDDLGAVHHAKMLIEKRAEMRHSRILEDHRDHSHDDDRPNGLNHSNNIMRDFCFL